MKVGVGVTIIVLKEGVNVPSSTIGSPFASGVVNSKVVSPVVVAAGAPTGP